MDGKENKEIEEDNIKLVERDKIKIQNGPSVPNLIMSTKVGNGHLVLDVDSAQLRYFLIGS